MTPAQRELLHALAASWRAIGEAASRNIREAHAAGLRLDRVLAGDEIVALCRKQASALDELAADEEPPQRRGCRRTLLFGGYSCGDVSLVGRVILCDDCTRRKEH